MNGRSLVAQVGGSCPSAHLEASLRDHCGQRLHSHLWLCDVDTLTCVSSSPAGSWRCLRAQMFTVIYITSHKAL